MKREHYRQWNELMTTKRLPNTHKMKWEGTKHRIGKLLLYALVAGFWLLQSDPIVMAARIAGEEGVSSTTSTQESKPKAQRPVRAEPPATIPSQRKPPQNQEKPTQKEVVPAVREASTEKRSDKPYVTIDFDNVDIGIFIKFISELTGKNFVVDKAVKGRVTIISPTKISVDEAYKVFESVLEVHGFTTVPAGKVIKIVPAVQARSKDIQTRLRQEAISAEDKVVTQLIPLKYADPNELKKLFAPLISKSSVIVSYPPTGMLIVTDVLSNIKRLLHIIDAIDVEGIGEEISIVPLKHATASNMEKTLNTLFQRTARTKKGATLTPEIKIVADERTNVLIVMASEYDNLKIKQLIDLLDRETPPGEGDIHVYYLENANAEELVTVLMAIPTKQTTGEQKGKAPVVSKEVQIVADKATNSMVITANKEDYLILEDVIKKLDVVRRMVYLEALLMEVDVGKGFDLGVQWVVGDEEVGTRDGKKIGAFGASNVGPNVFPAVDPGTGIVSLAQGLTLGVLGESITIGGISFPNIGAVIRAFQTDSDVHILSTPQIMTLDNEEAEIVVADNIPFLTRQDITTAEVTFSQYEFKDVGVTLRITPQINQERFVRLNIYQEVSQVVEQEEVGLPTTLTRKAKTAVTVKDGHTLVIGGLIDETLTDQTSSVPCLGNIPLLGWLFKSTSKSGDKKNLFMFLTPHIVENPAEAKKIYEEKREEIERVEEGVIKMYERKNTKDAKSVP